MYLDDCADAVRRWEGLVAWMYLDTAGVVTVANGRALFCASDADALPFMIGGRRASFAEVTADYERVKAMDKGHLPSHYRSSSSPMLEQADMDALLASGVERLDAQLRALMPAYRTAPDAAKKALFDIAYECGAEGCAHKFPHLDADAREGKWERCAADCHRASCSEARNEYTRALFEEAAKVS